jgi:hypothetical protein
MMSPGISGENGITLHAPPVCFMQLRMQIRAASVPEWR